MFGASKNREILFPFVAGVANGSPSPSNASPISSSILSGSSPASMRFMASSIAPVGCIPVSSNIRFMTFAIWRGSSGPSPPSSIWGAISDISCSILLSSTFSKGSGVLLLSASPFEIAKREIFFSSFLRPHFGHFGSMACFNVRAKKL